jgi:hypothetical protein
MSRHTYLDEVRWVGVKNTSGDSCPPFGVLAVVGTEMRGDDGHTHVIILGAKPSTTFRHRFVINGPTRLPAGGYGRCTRPDGEFWMDLDPSARSGPSIPVDGDPYGPKPGEWGMYKDFPGTIAEGMKTFIDQSRNALIAPVPYIDTILCRAVGAQTANTTIDSTDYKIWKGGISGGSDSGYTVLPNIYIQADFENDDFFLAYLVNGKWISPKGGTGGGTAGPRRFKAVLGAALSTDGSATVGSLVALDGGDAPEVEAADNPYRYAGLNGAACIVEEDKSGEEIAYFIADVERVGLFFVEDVENDPGVEMTKDRREIAVHTNDPATSTSTIVEYGPCTEVE